MNCTNCELKIKNINTNNCFDCKASEFIDVANISKNNKLYNAAIGRYYYSMFIRLSYLRNFYKKSGFSAYTRVVENTDTSNLGSHEETITILGKVFANSRKLSLSEKNSIQTLFRRINTRKEKRHIADYYFYMSVKENDALNAEKTVNGSDQLYPVLKGAV